jgi:hypothetical protein
MFWDLNGATAIPRRTRHRQIAATVTLLPTWDDVPTTNSDISVRTVVCRDDKNPCFSGRPCRQIARWITKQAGIRHFLILFQPGTGYFAPDMPEFARAMSSIK